MDQALKMVTRIAERGIKSAESVGDFESADIIRESMGFTLSGDEDLSQLSDEELQAIVDGG